MGRILIGTASWTDKTLIDSGAFYPKEASTPDKRLRFYAGQFPIVEVDSTYYFPPTEANSALWIERTPPGFIFHIKAYSLLTGHPTRPESIYPDLRPRGRSAGSLYPTNIGSDGMEEVWRRFAEALMPLHSAGKLGVVHFQFPPWFGPRSTNRKRILECAERLPQFQIAVEFRNRAWFDEANLPETLSFLGKHAIPVTSVDMPQGFRSSLPPVAVATSPDLAYVRFHGRNEQAWEAKHASATPRFAYLYSEEELSSWVPNLLELASKTKEVHVLMNNCYRDYAVTNARQLGGMLGSRYSW